MSNKRTRSEPFVPFAFLIIGIAGYGIINFWGSFGLAVTSRLLTWAVWMIASLILVIGGLVWFVIWRSQRGNAKFRALTLARIDQMRGLDFEDYVARAMKERGFETWVTQASGDSGADIVAQKDRIKYAIQVKRQSKPVSRRAVSDAVAAKDYYQCQAAMVITNNYFSDGASKLARSSKCELVDRDTLAVWIRDYSKNIQKINQ